MDMPSGIAVAGIWMGAGLLAFANSFLGLVLGLLGFVVTISILQLNNQ